MLSFLKDKNIIKSNKIVGVHCLVQPNGSMLLFYVLISRDKGKVTIIKSGTAKEGLDELVAEIQVSIPIYLSIDGKGVLSKKITLEQGRSPIQQVIPNASEEEFAIQQFQGVGNAAFVSLARKDVVGEIIDGFVQHKFQVLGLAIGPFKAVNLLSVFDHLPSDIQVGNYLISFDKEQGCIIDYKKLTEGVMEAYMIGEQELAPSYLLPFYHALTYYVADGDELQYPEIAAQFDEYASKRLFAFAGWGILLVLFLVLMVNTWLFTSYADKKQKLETHVAGNKELLGILTTLKEELAWKEKFLAQAGILKNTRMSYYADQVALSLPSDITLDKMEIHPISSKIKKQKEIELQPDKITIEGMANHSEQLNDWVNKLKLLSWVEEVSVVNYSRDENDVGVFSVEIEINRIKP